MHKDNFHIFAPNNSYYVLQNVISRGITARPHIGYFYIDANTLTCIYIQTSMV